jgi:hypothetical protein
MPKSTSPKASRNLVFATIPNYNPKTPKNPISPHPTKALNQNFPISATIKTILSIPYPPSGTGPPDNNCTKANT